MGFWAAAGSIAGGGLSAAGNYWAQEKANEANVSMQRETNAHNAMMQTQMQAWNLAQWKRENEYNSPEAQMQRFQEAGLNPNLIYGQQSLSAASPQGIASTDIAPQVAAARPGDSIANIIRDAVGIYAAASNADLQKSQADLAESQANLNQATTEKTRGETTLIPMTIKKMIADTNLSITQKKETEWRTELAIQNLLKERASAQEIRYRLNYVLPNEVKINNYQAERIKEEINLMKQSQKYRLSEEIRGYLGSVLGGARMMIPIRGGQK